VKKKKISKPVVLVRKGLLRLRLTKGAAAAAKSKYNAPEMMKCEQEPKSKWNVWCLGMKKEHVHLFGVTTSNQGMMKRLSYKRIE